MCTCIFVLFALRLLINFQEELEMSLMRVLTAVVPSLTHNIRDPTHILIQQCFYMLSKSANIYSTVNYNSLGDIIYHCMI
ncbi:hypothetical protein B0O99DRAFT_71377 [Bisporella sp. PMI_857]|nr:hypothetical protein B0O99DRAFT_71377 [Bisporella sp. PMI_857]